MKKKRKVLWIEDGARTDFQNMLGPVYVGGEYELVVALDATSGIAHLRKKEFDVVIVDLRIPPGENPKWRELYHKGHNDNANARLGMDILFGLLAPAEARIKLDYVARWVTPIRFAVFTVESLTQVKTELDQLGIQTRHQKTTEMTNRKLLEIIEEVITASLQRGT